MYVQPHLFMRTVPHRHTYIHTQVHIWVSINTYEYSNACLVGGALVLKKQKQKQANEVLHENSH